MPNRLKLQLIDGFSAQLTGRELVISAAPARLVLGYLALTPGLRESRAKLAAMIWEDSDDYRARRNLRQLLYGLRADLAGQKDHKWDGLMADRTSVSLRADGLQTDCDEIFEALEAGQVPDAIVNRERIHRSLLSGVPEQGELFASWLHLRRKEFENRLRSHLERIMTEGSGAASERAARALLGLDPSDEHASRQLIRLYSGRGDTGRALGIYSALWNHLDEVYGMEPAAQTQALIVEVKSGGLPPAPTTGERRVADRRASDRAARTGILDPGRADRKLQVAVLPISTAPGSAAPGSATPGSAAPGSGGSPDSETRVIAELFRTGLISRMVSFREFDVIDAAVRDNDGAYRLQLTMAQARDELALTATLTRTADGLVIWSDHFGQVAQNWWDHQADLAGRMAAACSLNLSRARLSELRNISSVQGAVDNWLLAQTLLNRFRAEDWDRAAACLRKAGDLDPSFSMAYSSLSQVHNIRHLVHPGLPRRRDLLLESKQLANRSIVLDPTDSRAHLCRAWACLLLGQYAHAEASFAMARQCNENDPWTVISSALGAAFGGETGLANRLASRFLSEGWTTRMSEWGYHACIHFLSGDDESCVAAAENAGDGIINILAWKAAAQWHLGEHSAARNSWQEFEAAARAHWTGKEAPTSGRILDWFLSCFPIRMRDSQERLTDGATLAAEAAPTSSAI